MSLALGCAGEHQRVGQAIDPLLGGPPAVPRPAGPTPATPTAATFTPTAPAPTSLTSNAALAAGTPRALDSANELRIHDTPRGPSGGFRQEAPGGAVLHRPVPVTPTVAHANPVLPPPAPAATPAFSPPPPAFSAGSRIATYEQAQSLLAARGVTWQRLETWGDKGEWKFTCSVPNKQNPFISRNYEAKSRDSLGALQAVLEQMDKER